MATPKLPTEFFLGCGVGGNGCVAFHDPTNYGLGVKPLHWMVLAMTLSLVLVGCTTTKSQQPPPLTQDDVISMARAGKTDQEIIQEIKTRRTFYRLAAKDIIHLHDQGVSDAVIDYMIDTEKQAIREEARYYSSRDCWYPYYGHWYYGPPNVIIYRRK